MTDPHHEDFRRINEAIGVLVEHYDTVQIFCTRHEAGQEDGTVNINTGVGNWFARVGQVKDWMVLVDEQTRVNARNRMRDSDNE